MNLTEKERTVKLNELLLKIHACTGWAMPNNEILPVFVDQFRKKMSESYIRMNVEEIEYAFRHYGAGVKEWGKNMNISIIDEVMKAYLTDKHNIPTKSFEDILNEYK